MFSLAKNHVIRNVPLRSVELLPTTPAPPTNRSHPHPITTHLHGPRNNPAVRQLPRRKLQPPIGPPPQRADPPVQVASMNARFIRPFARAAFRAPTAVRPSVMARPALIASQNKKAEVGPQQMVRVNVCSGGRQLMRCDRRSSSRRCPSSSPSSSSTRPPWPSSSFRRSSTSSPSTFCPSACACSRPVCSSASCRHVEWRMYK